MKNFKHLLTALLLFCATVATAHDFEVDGIYYNITSTTNKTVAVTYRGTSCYEYSSYTGDVVIPESATYDGTTYSVTSVGDRAFSFCSGLTSIVIGNSVTSIGNDVFERCTGLTSVVIGNSVTSIEYFAFGECTDLTSIKVDGSNTKYDSRENCNAVIETKTNTLILGCKNTVIPNSVTSIGNYAFYYCTGLTSIEIPNSVTNIGECAFERCTGLTSVEIPNSVTSIGEDAFRECTDLTSIKVDGSNTKYDSRENCNAIIETKTNTLILGCKNTVIPNSVTSIGEGAFSDCYGLTSIVIPNSVTSIGEGAFYWCSGLTSVVIGNSVTSIGERAFEDCTGLTSIEIPNSVTSIGNDAFYYTGWWNNQPDGLVYKDGWLFGYKGNKPTGGVVIKDGTKAIAGGAFSDCTGLTSIEIPNSVTSIGDWAFYYCSGLTSIEIPNSVTSIGEWAFFECDGLTSIEIPNSVTSIGDWAFYYCSGLTSVVIGNSVTSIGGYAFSYCSGLTSVVIGNSVTSIGSSAFYNCSGLRSIEIPNSVTNIGYWAFYNCSGLTSVVIGNSVTSIGSSAFYYCTNLKTVFNFSNLTFSEGTSEYGRVAYYADKVYNAPNGSMVGDFIFGKPNDVNTLLYYLGNATELTLPTDYNGENYKIGADVFKDNTTITSVVIPGCVTSIGNYAFNGCTSLKELRIVDGESTLSLGYNTYNGSDTGKGLFYDCPLRVLYLGRNLSYDTGRLCGYSPFNNMKALTSVNIGNSVTSIGRNTLYGCSGLTSITIPNSVTSIGDYAFNGCTGLKTIFNFSNFTFSKGSTGYGYVAYYADKVYNAPNGSFEGDFIFGKPNDVNTLLYYLGNATELTLPADYKEESYVIGSAVFKGKSAITSIEIPSTVTSIGSSAFYNCTGLTGIEIPSSVTSIGSSAFNGCSGLTSITIPNSVTIVENAAFSGCTGLTSVEIPNSVTSVGDDAFAGCSNVERLDLDCAEVGNWFCGVSVLKEVAVGSGVTSVLPSAFNGCTGLEKVCISDLAAWCSIDFGNEKANPLCYAKNLYLNGNLLTDVIIPGVITEIKDYAFYNCAELINITLPDGVKTIGQSAFNGCGSVETLYISSTIESIGDYAFAGCNNLFEIKIGSKKAITASENVFSNDAYNNACLFVPAGRKFAYEKTTPWNNFYIVEMDFTGIDEVNGENGMLDGVYYDLNGRAVENPANGVYIRNGKKVLVK